MKKESDNTINMNKKGSGEMETGKMNEKMLHSQNQGLNQVPEAKASPKELALVGLMAAIFLFIHFLYPPQAVEVYSISLNYLKEMVLIIPPVFILMGLFQVWVPKSFIQKYMGKEAGFKGAALAFVFGTIPTGPVYIAFPIAAGMLKKGARIMNINIFLGTWAAAKLPQLLIELKFLGPAFTALRFVLTVTSVVIIGFLVETLMLKKENQELSAAGKG